MSAAEDDLIGQVARQLGKPLAPREVHALPALPKTRSGKIVRGAIARVFLGQAAGDLASIDEAGNVSINGRSKDLIKSGGEWINPAEIEDIVGTHPTVGLAAVIARPDARWGERPVLIVESRQGIPLDALELLEFLRGKVASWWLPDQILEIDAMPLAATGKIDKNQLRSHYANGKLSARETTS